MLTRTKTVISTTQNDTNFDPSIYPDPHTFRPERRFESRYFNKFGRGTRSCIGSEVAYVELYLTVGSIFAPGVGFDLLLHDTDYERDVRMYHDYFSPFPKSNRGIRASVE